MTRILALIICFTWTALAAGQVTISSDNSQPDPSAMLDVKANTRGILIPRVALTGADVAAPVQGPATGLMVYNTATGGTPPNQVVEGYYYWDGSRWIPISPAHGMAYGDMQFWNGAHWVNIPAGQPGQYLQIQPGGAPGWMGPAFPVIITGQVTSFTNNTATGGGTVTSDGGSPVISRGLCWNTSPDPTTANYSITAGSGTGTFNAPMTNLQPGTTYFVRAWATNSAGTNYGQDVAFTTLSIPTVTTSDVTGTVQTTASCGGTVIFDGGLPVTARGVCWGLSPMPTTDGNKTLDGNGTGSFTSSITSLSPNTTYFVRAYAVNSIGTAYGNERTFTTLPPAMLPVVTTTPVTSVTNQSAATGGNVVSDGNSPVTVRGVCFRLTPSPTVNDDTTFNGTGTGIFTSQPAGLMGDTVYYLRAYATNAVGTSYGEELSFRTLPDPPPVCPGIPTVTYDGKIYNTVLIGNRCWFKENIDAGTRINGNQNQTDNEILEKYCLSDLEANCSLYGGLYQWNELTAYVNLSGGTGICPQGWHVPSFDEFTAMIDHLGGVNVAGGKMKTLGTTHWFTPNTGASNLSGFSALPGSFRSTAGSFVSPGNEGNYWSSTQHSSGFASIQLLYNSAAVGQLFYANNGLGFSARCIKDTCSTYTTASVSISTATTSICQGAQITFSATAVNGGTSPFYQWRVNGVKAGSNSPAFSYSPAGNDVVTCHLYSSLPCTSNPAFSNSVAITVLPNLPVSIIVNASANPVCSGTQATFTAYPVNGGSSPGYQWLLNNANIAGATNATHSFAPSNGNAVACRLTSSASCITGSPATSNTVTMTVNPQLPVSVSIAASANPVCAGTVVTFTATPANGGTSPSYQWRLNGNSISGATNATYSTTTLNGNIFTCLMTSNAACVSGNPATSNAITMTVNPLLPVSCAISASANPICSGANVTFTATPTNGGANPGFQWRVNGSNISGATSSTYTFVPANSNTVNCILTSNATCPSGNPATSNTLTMTVNPLLPVSVSIVASANPSCAGATVTYMATPVNGGNSPAYQWRVNGTNISGGTASVYSFVPANGNTINCILTSSETCKSGSPATSATITQVVSPVNPVSVSINASANPVCTGTSVTVTATPVNGGATPAWQWRVNGTNVTGATNQSYQFTPSNGNTVSCILTSNATCTSGNPATSNTLTMTVNPLQTVGVSIAASANPVCSGTSVTFSATPVNGGTSPGYQWRVNGSNVGGATNSTYSYSPSNGNAVSCVLTSNIGCPSGNPATSNTVTMTVNPILPVSVSVAASSNPSCSGSSVTYTATPTNGGSSPAYQWMVNSSNVTGATNAIYSFFPASGNTIKCTLTSSETCKSGSPATSNTITQSITSLTPVSVSITASANPVCAGISVTFTATPVNGGTNPGYQWKVDGANVSAATNATFTFVPANGNTISCILTSSISCPSGNPAVSNTITMTINPQYAVSVSIAPSSYAVPSGTSVTFTATPVNGGTSPVYQWKKNGVNVGTNSSTYTYNPSNNDNVSCQMTSNQPGCLSNNPALSNTVNMIVYTTGTACTSGATVDYGGQTYNTVQIGTQCWLRENLNIGTMIDGANNQLNNAVVEKYCYNNDPSFCNIYGGLYQWAELVQYLNGATNTSNWSPSPSGNVQGLCPQGWHLPTNSELTTMYTYMGGVGVSGGKMKEIGTVHWLSPNTSAANTYGFTALPAGYLYSAGYSNLQYYAHMWTASVGTSTSSTYWFGAAYNVSGRLAGEGTRTTGYSARCLKD